MSVTLHEGDCLDVMRGMAADSVDSVVCDPPYHLQSIVKRFGCENAAPAKGGVYARSSAGFMGKQWDGGDIAFDPATWAEVLRVLKPGAHLVAFSGGRTYHRMACAIEDAGFEIRDQIMWLYGSGFPKSHSVSVAIDKAAGAEREVVGVRPKDNARMDAGQGVSGLRQAGGHAGEYENVRVSVPITAPATDLARQWDGWGTALKPAHEPIVLARKPLGESTVAANVLRHGTGAINVDGCRVECAAGDYTAGGRNEGIGVRSTPGEQHPRSEQHAAGRWPANLVHDGSDEVLEAFARFGSAGCTGKTSASVNRDGVTSFMPSQGQLYSDTGTAARFFYCAKASKADRMGTTHPTTKPVSLISWLATMITPPGGTILDPFAGSGTLAVSALRLGFNAILIEREPEYVAMIRQRLAAIEAEAPLLCEVA